MNIGDNLWYTKQCINDDRVFEQNKLDCCKREKVLQSKRKFQCSLTDARPHAGPRERIITVSYTHLTLPTKRIV